MSVDYAMQVDDVITETDGFTPTNRIKVTFPDIDSDGVVDNPDVFDIVVGPDVNASTKVVSTQLAQAVEVILHTHVDVVDIEQRYTTQAAINEVLAQFSSGQVSRRLMTSFLY